MKKLALIVVVFMSSVVAIPAMADIYSGQQLRHAEMRQVHHDRRVARHIHQQEVHKMRHARRLERKEIRHERRVMHRMAVVR